MSPMAPPTTGKVARTTSAERVDSNELPSNSDVQTSGPAGRTPLRAVVLLERALRGVSDLPWRAALEAPELLVDARSFAGFARGGRAGGARLALLPAALLFDTVATVAIQLGTLPEPVDLFRE